MKLQIFIVDNRNISDDKNKELLLDDTFSEEDIADQPLKTTEEERQGTIPGFRQVTVMALMCSQAQVNPTVKRGQPIKRYKKKNKNPQSKAT